MKSICEYCGEEKCITSTCYGDNFCDECMINFIMEQEIVLGAGSLQ